jgi:hypothetical protein
MFLIAKHAVTLAVTAHHLTDEQHDRFQNDTSIDEAFAGWAVTSPVDLLSATVTVKDLLTLYNTAMGPENQLVKFARKQSAAERVFPLLERLARPFDDLLPAPAKKEPMKKNPIQEKVKKATTAKKADNGEIFRDAKDKLYPARAGSKQALLIDMLSVGATMDQLVAALGWERNSVKSGIYWDLNTIKGYGAKTVFVDGVATYHLILPAGFSEPLPHSTPKA